MRGGDRLARRKDSSHEPKPGRLGSFEASNRPYYPNVEAPTKAQRTNIVNASLSFKTDKAPMPAFRTMLRILVKRKFSNAIEYDGPELGLSDSTREMVPMDAVMEALQGKDGASVPFGGFRMVMIYDLDDQVSVKLKVKDGTKIKLKLKGTLAIHAWDKIRADVRRKFHIEV
jgi:hypothetical protein